jgi:hypothetical protein
VLIRTFAAPVTAKATAPAPYAQRAGAKPNQAKYRGMRYTTCLKRLARNIFLLFDWHLYSKNRIPASATMITTAFIAIPLLFFVLLDQVGRYHGRRGYRRDAASGMCRRSGQVEPLDVP